MPSATEKVYTQRCRGRRAILAVCGMGWILLLSGCSKEDDVTILLRATREGMLRELEEVKSNPEAIGAPYFTMRYQEAAEFLKDRDRFDRPYTVAADLGPVSGQQTGVDRTLVFSWLQDRNPMVGIVLRNPQDKQGIWKLRFIAGKSPSVRPGWNFAFLRVIVTRDRNEPALEPTDPSPRTWPVALVLPEGLVGKPLTISVYADNCEGENEIPVFAY